MEKVRRLIPQLPSLSNCCHFFLTQMVALSFVYRPTYAVSWQRFPDRQSLADLFSTHLECKACRSVQKLAVQFISPYDVRVDNQLCSSFVQSQPEGEQSALHDSWHSNSYHASTLTDGKAVGQLYLLPLSSHSCTAWRERSFSAKAIQLCNCFIIMV